MAWMTKYSRAYEKQADTLGAQIMADAGYDPRDLANVFRTIQSQERGGGVPQWLSSHPDPGQSFRSDHEGSGDAACITQPYSHDGGPRACPGSVSIDAAGTDDG